MKNIFQENSLPVDLPVLFLWLQETKHLYPFLLCFFFYQGQDFTFRFTVCRVICPWTVQLCKGSLSELHIFNISAGTVPKIREMLTRHLEKHKLFINIHMLFMFLVYISVVYGSWEAKNWEFVQVNFWNGKS